MSSISSVAQSQGRRLGGRVEWEQSREGVKHADCLVVETVFEPAGFGPKTLQSPPRQR